MNVGAGAPGARPYGLSSKGVLEILSGLGIRGIKSVCLTVSIQNVASIRTAWVFWPMPFGLLTAPGEPKRKCDVVSASGGAPVERLLQLDDLRRLPIRKRCRPGQLPHTKTEQRDASLTFDGP